MHTAAVWTISLLCNELQHIKKLTPNRHKIRTITQQRSYIKGVRLSAPVAVRPANERGRWWPREKPLHNGQYASNAEGDDDGKNQHYAENHDFR